MDKTYKGQLVRWNEDKGFGFISPENEKRDVFIHISALKEMSRKPIVGDFIFYQIYTDNTDKTRAVNAKIEGVAVIKAKVRKNKRGIYKKNNWFVQMIFVIIIVLVGFEGYKKLNGHQLPIKEMLLPETAPANDIYRKKYSCDGKIHCSEMTSCEEATFYQNNCPGTKMDGDGDGIPCESQWCSW